MDEKKPDGKATRVRIAMNPGPYRREMAGYVWEEANGFMAEVDLATAAECLTYPSGVFTLAERPTPAVRKALADELGIKPENLVMPGEGAAAPERSVSSIVGGKRAMDLGGLGLTRVGQLAALDADGIERLAASIGASRAEVGAWVEQAKQQ